MYRMVSSQVFCRIIAGILFLLCVGCRAYRIVPIEVYSPGQLQTTDTAIRIAVLNRNIIRSTDTFSYLYNVRDVSREKLIHYFTKGLWECSQRAEDSVKVCGLIDPEVTVIDWNETPDLIPAEEILNIAARFRIDYIVSVESRWYDRHIKRDSICTNWLVRTYDCRLGVVVDTMTYTDKLSLSGIVPVGNFNGDIAGTAWDKGYQYGDRIFRSWRPVDRRVYRRGAALKMADACFRDKRLEEARRFWTVIMKQSPKMAVRAGVSLAWSYENEDDFRSALGVLKNAKTMNVKGKEAPAKDMDYLEEYIKEMERRLEEMDRISNEN